MTFDQFANQGDTAAWDPAAAAATKKAADKIFTGEADGIADDAEDADPATGTDDITQDPHPPGEVPDPDITREP